MEKDYLILKRAPSRRAWAMDPGGLDVSLPAHDGSRARAARTSRHLMSHAPNFSRA
jgi:hypothetical protein